MTDPTDPTPLATRIAREHRFVREGWSSSDCSCDPGGYTYSLAGFAAHIATVTEQAIAERDAAQVARFVGHDGVSRFTVNELSDLRAGDFVIHPTVDGVAIARGWQQRFEAVTERAVRARVAAELRFSDAEWREYQNLPELGHPHRAWLDSRAARIAKGAPDA